MRETALERDEREEARIEARRQRAALRQQMLRGAKNGCGVVDKRSIEAQLYASAERERLAREEERRYAERTAAVSMALVEEEEEEKRAKATRLQKLREEWDKQKTMPKNEAIKMSPPVHLDRCGLAAVQRLEGDCAKDAIVQKNLRQARQTRTWAAEQIANKEARSRAEQQEEQRFAEWEKHVLQQRKQMELAQKEAQKESRRQLSQEYTNTAAARRYQRIEEKRITQLADQAEIERNLTDPILNEAYSLHDDGRVRVDHFRGFTKGQTKSIYADNEIVKQNKYQQQQFLQEEDRRLNQQLDSIQTAMLQAEYHKDFARKTQATDLKQDLEKQRLFDQYKKAMQKQEQFGAVADGSILHGFGTSYR